MKTTAQRMRCLGLVILCLCGSGCGKWSTARTSDNRTVVRPAVVSQAMFAGMTVVPLTNGLNEIDIDGDECQDLVFVARRENFNAHGYTMVTFYRQRRLSNDQSCVWEIVPFDNEGDSENEDGGRADSFCTNEGADGYLLDLLVMRMRGATNAPVSIVIGEREFGESFADSQPVKFMVYELRENKEGVPGWAPEYFALVRTVCGRTNHVDVAEAFETELGLSKKAPTG